MPPALRRGVLAAILLAAATVQGFNVVSAKLLEGDALGFYLPMAKSFAAGDVSGLTHPMLPAAYPALVGWSSRLLPRAAYPLELAGRGLSLAFFLVTILLVASLARRIWNDHVALAAAAVTASNPVVSAFASRVGPETLFAAIVVGVVRQLVVYHQRRRMKDLVLLVLLATVAGFVRSEGWVLGPLALLAAGLLRAGRGRPQGARLTVAVVIYGAVVLLRCGLVYAQTGLFVPDVRMAGLMGMGIGKELAGCYRPLHAGDPGPLARQLASRIVLPLAEANKGDTPWKEIGHPTTIVEIVLLALVIVGSMWREPPRYAGRYEIVLGLFAGTFLLFYALVAVSMRLAIQSRQLANLAPLLSPWAAIGLIRLGQPIDRLRRRREQWWNRWIGSWRGRMGGLMVLLLMSIPGSLGGPHRGGFKTLGAEVLERRGPGQRLLETGGGQMSFYAKAEFLPLPVYLVPGYITPLSVEQLLIICRQSDADCLLADQYVERWCPGLSQRLDDEGFARSVTICQYPEKRKLLRVLDVHRLLAAMTPDSAPIISGLGATPRASPRLALQRYPVSGERAGRERLAARFRAW